MNDVLFDIHEGVATVTINRPHRKNALCLAASQRLHELWGIIDEDPAVRVAIVTAAPCSVFCAGMDLAEAAAYRREHGTDMLKALADPFYERLRAVKKPVIAALTGHLAGAGLVIAVNADLRIGLAGTRAGATEAKVGRGTAWAVPMLSMLPQALLMELVLTGEMVPVERLHAMGFFNYLEATPEAVQERALHLAKVIAGNAPLSVLAAKEGLRLGAALGAEEGLQASKRIHEVVYASEDAQEGPRAFAEKRKPVWQGR